MEANGLREKALKHINDVTWIPRWGRDRIYNMGAHSWSSRGNWTPVCFTLDGRYAQAMYDKPREITRGSYRGDGIEIAAWSSMGITPEFALELWQDSRAHDQVILEKGAWRGSDWKAMGVALGGNFAFIWFGKEPDPGSR
jgi:hypothetical protein